MRSWLILVGLVVAALVAVGCLAGAFPSNASAIFLIGTPIVVVGAGLGAKFVQRRTEAMRHARGSVEG